MTTTEIMTFDDFCKETIKNELSARIGGTYYACDLGQDLTRGMNCDGTFTYSTELAKEYLREWWWDASDYFQYEKDNFGENFHNPFDNPEAYIVCMVIEGVRSLLSQCNEIDDAWNDKIELTEELVGSIIEQLDDLEVRW